MPSVCTCDCGFTVEDGRLCLDWAVVGMKRECSTGDGYSNALDGGAFNWVTLRDELLSWSNTTCRTHRVIARIDVPWLRIRVGRNNTWFARAYLDGAINAAPPFDTTREPELQWSTNWYSQMPEGTETQQEAPGSAEVGWFVAPGDTLTVGGRMLALTQFYTAQTNNLLAFGPYRVSLAAWPSDEEAASGRDCQT